VETGLPTGRTSVRGRAPKPGLCIARSDAARGSLHPSNIAEGAERGGKDFTRFLRMARGSAAELRTQCYIAAKAGVIATDQMNRFVSELKDISRMLTGLAHSLKTEN